VAHHSIGLPFSTTDASTHVGPAAKAAYPLVATVAVGAPSGTAAIGTLTSTTAGTAYRLNLLPTKATSAPSPQFALFDATPSYAYLRVFGCACYLNTSATDSHKSAPVPVGVSSLGTPLSISRTDV
jgi:hypothetical protein